MKHGIIIRQISIHFNDIPWKNNKIAISKTCPVCGIYCSSCNRVRFV